MSRNFHSPLITCTCFLFCSAAPTEDYGLHVGPFAIAPHNLHLFWCKTFILQISPALQMTRFIFRYICRPCHFAKNCQVASSSSSLSWLSLYIVARDITRGVIRSHSLAEFSTGGEQGSVFCAKACMRTYLKRRAYFKRPTKYQATSVAHEIP